MCVLSGSWIGSDPGNIQLLLERSAWVDVGLIKPGGVARHDSVPVAGHRGEHTIPTLEGRLVGDAEQLGRALDGDVVAHEPDEGSHGGKRLAAVLEDCAREGGEPPAAASAARPRDPGHGGPVPPGAPGATIRAPRVRPVGRRGLDERADADLVAAAPLVDGFSEQQDSSAVRRTTSAIKGFALPIWICPIRPSAHPEGLSPNKDLGVRSGGFFVWMG